MSGAAAYYHESGALERNLSLSGPFYLKAWMTLHILASLAGLLLFSPSTSTDSQKHLIFMFNLLLGLDGMVLLIFASRIIHASAANIANLHSTIATLRASLRSATAVVASQPRYVLQIANAINPFEGQSDLSIAENEIAQVPAKLVAYADPSDLSELHVEASQNFSKNLKGTEFKSAENQAIIVPKEDETGEIAPSGKLAEERDGLNCNPSASTTGKPSWVEDGTLCVVCHNPFGPEGAHVLGTCGHVFHPPCLVDYSKVKRHCFCDMTIHSSYYASICLQEIMPPEWRDSKGRSTLHGDFDWRINVHS